MTGVFMLWRRGITKSTMSVLYTWIIKISSFLDLKLDCGETNDDGERCHQTSAYRTKQLNKHRKRSGSCTKQCPLYINHKDMLFYILEVRSWRNLWWGELPSNQYLKKKKRSNKQKKRSTSYTKQCCRDVEMAMVKESDCKKDKVFRWRGKERRIREVLKREGSAKKNVECEALYKYELNKSSSRECIKC